MKAIILKVSDEQYEAYQLDKKFQLNSDAGGMCWDDEQCIALIGGGVRTTIDFIKKLQKYLETGDESILHWDYCITKYAGKPTKRCLKEIDDMLHNEESIACVKHWNKYHKDDQVQL